MGCNEAVERRTTIAFTQAGTEKVAAECTIPGNTYGRAIQVATRIQVCQPVAVLGWCYRTIIGQLIQQHRGIADIGEWIVR